MSALFVAVQVSVDKAHIAPAVSMVFLASGLGTVLGLAGSSAVYQAGLRSTLESRLVSLHLDAGVREQVSLRSPLHTRKMSIVVLSYTYRRGAPRADHQCARFTRS